jgi:peptidase M15-like protein
MIALLELLKGKDIKALPQAHQANVLELLKRINIIRVKYNKPMTVTSGYRSMEEHIAVYAKKGITDKAKIPMKSRHLSGEAVDIYDPNKALKQWILINVKILEEVGLWLEDFTATPNWVHFQIKPPASGKRFFRP